MAIKHAQTADVLESIRVEISILSIKALLAEQGSFHMEKSVVQRHAQIISNDQKVRLRRQELGICFV